MEVKSTNTPTTASTIQQLHSIFATHGLPEMLVTYNASLFTREEFKLFTKQNSIRYVTSAPYHPASNGLGEYAVKTIEEFMKKTSGDPINITTFGLNILIVFIMFNVHVHYTVNVY